MAVDRQQKDIEWYCADDQGRVYDTEHATLAVLMDIRRELRTVNQRLLYLRFAANDIRNNTRPRPRRRITAKQAARALAQRGARAQVPEALRPGALPTGRHRGLRGVLPGDIDEDRHGPGQCRLKCSDSSVDIDKYRRFATWRHRRPSGRARFQPIERPQSASADRSSGLLKINNLPSVRAGW